MTVFGSISKLRRAAQFIALGRDFTWLVDIERDLALMMRPRSKFDRMVMTEVLVEAGLTLIHEAESSPNLTDLARACQVRNGLMVAVLALCPIRRKNFVALEIGRSFVQIHDTWWIVLSAAETKENRPDERPIDKLLTPVINRYLSQHRPVLARTDNPPSALWLSSTDGAPMSYVQKGVMIKISTLATVSVDVSPHLFRAAAASTVATRGGKNPFLASALLHHSHPSVTNAHYNRATSLSAADRCQRRSKIASVGRSKNASRWLAAWLGWLAARMADLLGGAERSSPEATRLLTMRRSPTSLILAIPL